MSFIKSQLDYFHKWSPYFQEITVFYPALFIIIYLLFSLLGLTSYIWFLAKCIVVVRLFKVGMTLVRAFSIHYVVQKLNWNINLKEYAGSYAVITGCTDGIGKAYAVELAKKGIKKFILIGRNDTKLAATTQILKKNGAQDIKKVVFDFASDDFSKLDEVLTQNDIGILVNSAGIAPENMGKITSNRPNFAVDMARVNGISVIKTCETVLRGMEERNKGIIVNISSVQAWRPVPLLSSYSASKAMVSFFTRCISFDYRTCGIKTQCLVPILVATKMTHYEKGEGDNKLVVTPEEYARQAVSIIGLHSMSSGCWQHELQVAFCTLFPTWLLFYLLMPVYWWQCKRIQKTLEKNN